MAVYKRGSVYWYEFVFGGQRIQRSAKTRNLRAAREIEAAAKLALARGDAGLGVRAKAPTLAEFLPRVLDYLATTRPASATYYRDSAKPLLGFAPLAGCRLNAITSELVARFVAWRRAQPGVGLAGTNKPLAVLRRATRLAAEWGVCPLGVRVKLVPGERPREAVLPPEQAEEFFSRLRPDVAACARLAYHTLLRPSNARTLLWSDFTPPAEGGGRWWLRIPAQRMKARRDYAAPLSQSAAAALAGVPRLADRLFPNLSGQVFARELRRVRRDMGLDEALKPHGLRHSGATRLAASGVDTFALRDLMSHANISTTMRYVHPQAQTLEAAAAKMDEWGRVRKVPTKVPTPAPRRVGGKRVSS